MFKNAGIALTLAVTTMLSVTSCSKDDNDDKKERTPNNSNSTVKLFVGSNTGASFNMFDVSEPTDINTKKAFTLNIDADGIAYNSNLDLMLLVNRTESKVDGYTDVNDINSGVSLMADFSSSSDFNNGREIAINDSKIIVADDVDGNNRLIVYNYNNSAITLDKIVNVDINLWGIHLDGNTLYAIQDNSDTLAVYENFFVNNPGVISPSYKIQVEGIVRTHGITYDSATDVMILTNIGSAASDADGGIHVISDFTTKSINAQATGKIEENDQIIIEGPSTMLGNPVDVAYDRENNRIYVAERAKDGGRILGFNFPTLNGDVLPVYSGLLPGASSVYISL